MNSCGFIYVLINPSMPDLVKVGRTSRDPESRVKELSSATGVPTPFILAYDAYFEDCVWAEKYIHNLLEEQGCRLSRNREFFNAPLNIVIKTTIQAEKALSDIEFNNTLENFSDHNLPIDRSASNLLIDPITEWEEVFEEAEEYYYGFGDTLQDYKKALMLFKKAAQLGAANAYRVIGSMYRDGDLDGIDYNLALQYFKEGTNKGDGRCWAEMAKLYRYEQPENAKKCWKNYFQSRSFLEDYPYDSFYNRIYYAFDYMFSLDRNYQSAVYEAKLAPLKNELIDFAKERIKVAESNPFNGDDLYWEYKRTLRRIENLKS